MKSERDGDFFVNVARDGCLDGFDDDEERLGTREERHEDDAEYTRVPYSRPVDIMSSTSSSSNGSSAELCTTGDDRHLKHNAGTRPSAAAAPTSGTATEMDSDLEESRSDLDKEKELATRDLEAAEDKRDGDNFDAEGIDEECKGLESAGSVEETNRDRFNLAIALDFETDTNAAMSIGPPSVTRQTSRAFQIWETMMISRLQMRSQYRVVEALVV